MPPVHETDLDCDEYSDDEIEQDEISQITSNDEKKVYKSCAKRARKYVKYMSLLHDKKTKFNSGTKLNQLIAYVNYIKIELS